MPQPKRPSPAVWLVMGFAWRLGYSIAIPLVLLLIIGRLLDRRWGTHPWMLLAGLLLSLIVTSVLLFRESLRVMREAGGGENSDLATTAVVGQSDSRRDD